MKKWVTYAILMLFASCCLLLVLFRHDSDAERIQNLRHLYVIFLEKMQNDGNEFAYDLDLILREENETLKKVYSRGRQIKYIIRQELPEKDPFRWIIMEELGDRSEYHYTVDVQGRIYKVSFVTH